MGTLPVSFTISYYTVFFRCVYVPARNFGNSAACDAGARSPPSCGAATARSVAPQLPSRETTYPLQLVKGLVGDSRILNVEEWTEDAVKLASLANYGKQPIEVKGQPVLMFAEVWYRRADGQPLMLITTLDPQGKTLLRQRRVVEQGTKLADLVPPPQPTTYPLTVKPGPDGQNYALVNQQPVRVADQITHQGQTDLFFWLLYSLPEKEYTVDGGSNKRRGFYSAANGAAYEVITKYNGVIVRVTPLPATKPIHAVMPFAFFAPGYGLTENARGYCKTPGRVTDPNSLVANRPPCTTARQCLHIVPTLSPGFAR